MTATVPIWFVDFKRWAEQLELSFWTSLGAHVSDKGAIIEEAVSLRLWETRTASFPEGGCGVGVL
jgi:hypothetical protein